MTARERILMIRLMEKLKKHAAYDGTLGIETAGTVGKRNEDLVPKGLANV